MILEIELSAGDGNRTCAVHQGEVVAHSNVPLRDAARHFLAAGCEASDVLKAKRDGRSICRQPLHALAR